MEDPIEFNNKLELLYTNDISTPLNISVFTVCAELGSEIDLEKIYDNFMDGECGPYEIKYDPFADKFFGNCLLVNFEHKDKINAISKISAKIFCNGKLQIAGCKNIYSAHEVPDIIESFVRKFAKNSIKKISQFGILKKSISMINSNFKINSNGLFINQQKLKDIVNNNCYDGKKGEWRTAVFQPGKYHGVNIKYWIPDTKLKYRKHIETNKKIPKKIEGQISIFVFRSGSVTITGAKNSLELKYAYTAITNLFRNHKDDIFYKF